MKVGVLGGAGRWGSNITATLKRLGQQVIVCDPASPEHTDESEILADDDVLAVCIATPAHQHQEQALRALRANKHVFLEKPLASSLDGVLEIWRSARARERVLMPGHRLMRYHPAAQRMLQILGSGVLGPVQSVFATRTGRPRTDAGPMLSLLPHDIDLAIAIASVDDVTYSVDCDVQPSTTIVGDRSFVQMRCTMGDVNVVLTGIQHEHAREQRMMVVCERGAMTLDTTRATEDQLVVRHPPSVHVTTRPCGHEQPLTAELRDFLDAVQCGGVNVERWMQDALRVANIMQQAQDAEDNEDEDEFAVLHRLAHAVLRDSLDVAVPMRHAPEPSEQPLAGEGTVMWEHSRITRDSSVGKDVMLGRNVSVEGAVVGDRCRIQNNVTLYSGVTLEEDVFVGPGAIFTNVRYPKVRKQDESRPELDKTLVRRGAVIGAGAVIVCGVTIGEEAMVGAGAVVTRDVPPGTTVVGNPAMPVGYRAQRRAS